MLEEQGWPWQCPMGCYRGGHDDGNLLRAALDDVPTCPGACVSLANAADRGLHPSRDHEHVGRAREVDQVQARPGMGWG